MENNELMLRLGALEEKIISLDEKVDTGFKHMDEVFVVRVQQIDSRLDKKDEEANYFFTELDKLKETKYQVAGIAIAVSFVIPYLIGRFF